MRGKATAKTYRSAVLKALVRDERKMVELVKIKVTGWKIEGRGAVGAVRRFRFAQLDLIVAALRSRSWEA